MNETGGQIGSALSSWLARTCLTIRRNPMTQPFARRLRNILIRERLNPADVARRLGRGHADVVAVSNWFSGATSQICGICCDSPPRSAPIPPNC